MLLEHLGAALAARPAAPRRRSGSCVQSQRRPDLLWFGLVAVGIDRSQLTPPKHTADSSESSISYPWWHGLGRAGVWSAAATAVAARRCRDRQTAAVIGLLVVSHWLLDVLAHTPDLPLLFDRSPEVGLGLEYSLQDEVHWQQAEMGLLAAGIAIYRRDSP